MKPEFTYPYPYGATVYRADKFPGRIDVDRYTVSGYKLKPDGDYIELTPKSYDGITEHHRIDRVHPTAEAAIRAVEEQWQNRGGNT